MKHATRGPGGRQGAFGRHVDPKGLPRAPQIALGGGPGAENKSWGPSWAHLGCSWVHFSASPGLPEPPSGSRRASGGTIGSSFLSLLLKGCVFFPKNCILSTRKPCFFRFGGSKVEPNWHQRCFQIASASKFDPKRHLRGHKIAPRALLGGSGGRKNFGRAQERPKTIPLPFFSPPQN